MDRKTRVWNAIHFQQVDRVPFDMFDEAGYLCLTGRAKEIIVTPAGKNVYPREVEALYGELPGLREICETLRPGLRITGHQSLLFTDVRAEDRQGLEEILRRHGVKLSEEISTVRRWSMACVAMPT